MNKLGAWLTIIFVGIVGVLVGWPQPILEESDIHRLAHDFMGLTSTSSTPLKGLVVVITGATSGIGKSLTRALFRMGATVVVIGREQQKLEKLGEELPGVVPIVADLGDLSSVSNAANTISRQFDRVDVLVNNAGMHYHAHLKGGKRNPTTVQNYDLSFGVNYLSHFLLTEKLLVPLRASNKTTILQVSSSFHWAVDGTDLAASKTQQPAASIPGISSGLWGNQRAYANAKLAQLLHARALTRRNAGQDSRIISICPGWVATDIGGGEGSLVHMCMNTFGFPPDGWGTAAALYAILRKDGADFVTSSGIFRRMTYLLPEWFFYPFSATIRVRDAGSLFMASALMLFQKFDAVAFPSRSSPESYNATLQESLYEWSKGAVAEWL